jgi:ParB family chromosome partitioning protein
MGQKELEILKEVFAQLGRMSWESFTSNRLPLLNLPTDILEELRKGKIEYTKAKIIAQVNDEEQRKNLLRSAIEENLSIRAIREKVKQIQETLPNSSSDFNPVEPPQRVDHLTKRIKKKKLWQNSPKRWQQIEAYLQKIEELLEKFD